MAQQTKNKKKVPLEKQARAAMFWPDLPQMLLDIIGKDSTLMQNISYGGVTKSWRAAAKQCSPNAALPWLQLSDDHFHVPRTYDDVTQPADQFNKSFHQGYTFWPCSWPSSRPLEVFPWLLTQCIERDPIVPFMRVVISSLDEDYSTRHCTVIVLTGTSHPAFVYYRLRGKGEVPGWVKQDCTLTDPHCQNRSGGGKFLQFTNAIGFKGRFYALSLQGTVAEIIVDGDFNLRIRALSSKRAVPSVFSKHFTEYLVESDGRILLVFLISRKTTKVVDDVEVFQLNIKNLSWEKMGNDGWWEFDMEKGSISPTWKDATSRTEFPVWIGPVPEE
ncbi:hypothetical protein SLA2020_372490 [Shorea laevis]